MKIFGSYTNEEKFAALMSQCAPRANFVNKNFLFPSLPFAD